MSDADQEVFVCVVQNEMLSNLIKKQQKRRINRTLTQKYDMHSLRALQNLEAELMQKLSVVYGCDEEDVPVELDLLKIYNDEPTTRREQIVSIS